MTTFKLAIFRFDSKTDYLPYYKNYEVSISREKTLLELLEEIKRQDLLFEYPKDQEELGCVVINKHTIATHTTLKDIVEYFGEELILEPLSKKRATKDLIINNQDFKNSLTPILKYIDENDKKHYQEFMRFYYASEMLEFNENFQGTSLFLFVHKLILKNNPYKKELLEAICDEENGIWYHTPLCHKTFPKEEGIEEIIVGLKKDILASDIKIQKVI